MILFPLTSDPHFSRLSSSPSPLRVTHLPSPVLPPSEFATSKAWPGAKDHCAVVVRDEVFVLCGSQKPNSDYLPNKFVHRFQPSSAEWNRDTTTGDVPPNLIRACDVAIGSVIYVFGGFDGSRRQNDLRSYDTITKVWLLIKPDGKSPSGQGRIVRLERRHLPFLLRGIVLHRRWILVARRGNGWRHNKPGGLIQLENRHVVQRGNEWGTTEAESLCRSGEVA
jgi:hypothetical protein